MNITSTAATRVLVTISTREMFNNCLTACIGRLWDRTDHSMTYSHFSDLLESIYKECEEGITQLFREYNAQLFLGNTAVRQLKKADVFSIRVVRSDSTEFMIEGHDVR